MVIGVQLSAGPGPHRARGMMPPSQLLCCEGYEADCYLSRVYLRSLLCFLTLLSTLCFLWCFRFIVYGAFCIQGTCFLLFSLCQALFLPKVICVLELAAGELPRAAVALVPNGIPPNTICCSGGSHFPMLKASDILDTRETGT